MNDFFLKFEFDIIHLFHNQYFYNIQQKELLVSPYSIGICLSYIANLVNSDKIRHDIIKSFHCNDNTQFSQFMERVKSIESQVETEYNQDILKTANILFTDISLNDLSEHEIGYLPDIVNFSIMCSTSSMINRTVKKRTSGRISGLINPFINCSRSSFVMSSISLFECEWDSYYKKRFTIANRTFHGFESKKIVPMIQLNSEEVLFSCDKTCFAIDLPFSKDKFSLFAIMPKKKSFRAFNKMINGLNQKKFSYLLNSTKLTRMNVIIPKFTIETDSFNIINLMERMGIENDLVFTSDRHMHQLCQKCCFSLTENGAIPIIEHNLEESYSASKNKKVKSGKYSFKRPFIFFVVRHNPDIILLSGIIAMPICKILND